MCGISGHNNTKFLHTIAEVCLYLVYKNGTVTCIWSLTSQFVCTACTKNGTVTCIWSL